MFIAFLDQKKWCCAVLGHVPLLFFSIFKFCTTKTPEIVVLITSCIAEVPLPMEGSKANGDSMLH